MAGAVDYLPAEARLFGYAGDPFDFRLRLLGPDGDPVDVSQWDWRATVVSKRLRLDFETQADEEGVRLWLRGDDTARLPTGHAMPFDVTCRQPTAGEGRTVLRGRFVLAARVTDPLRSDPEVVPA